MPDKTGYDVFESARKKSQILPVILMTGFGYDPNHCIVRASQEGLQAVLFKPFKVEQMLAEVRKAIQSQPVKQN
jgi:FixJ family two-component response regulator